MKDKLINYQINEKPNIADTLLWEFDLTTFNYRKSYKIVIDRVLLRGTISDWKAMMKFYNIEQIKETIEWTKQIGEREKAFARLFIQSDLINDASQE